MSTVDKIIFKIFLVIIIVLIGVIAYTYFKTKNEIMILSETGNEIIQTAKIKTKELKVQNKTYEDENKTINYPYLEGIKEATNEKIKSYALQEENVNLNYEIELASEKLISILFYGKKDNSNYSKTLNILNEKIIETNEIFKEKNEMAVILKSTYASEYLENEGQTIKQNYLNNISYEDLLNNGNISLYFKETNLGIVVNNIPNGLKDYLKIEINYNNLDNPFIEKETQKEPVDETKIREFITNKLISSHDRIENTYPEGYIFTENGNFSYNNGENEDLYTDKTISYRGTWWIENNKLILHVIEEEKITNGEIIDGVFVNYQKKIIPTDYNIEYEINEIKDAYMIINNYEIMLYKLNPIEEYINQFKILADSGYKEYNKIVQR